MLPLPTPPRTYTKPPTDFETQLQKLKDRGLNVPDESRALRYLKNISYYRLSGYWFACLDRTTGRFIEEATFDDVLRAYRFDKKLRMLCMEAIERIEIALRTQIVQHFTLAAADNNWYEKPVAFKSSTPKERQERQKLIRTIVGDMSQPLRDRKGELPRAKDKVFIAEYLTNYDVPANPPSWMALEVVSYGTLTALFRLFGDNAARGKVAAHFKVALSVFESWIQSINHIRNKFAHHERFWDLDMRPINTNAPNTQPFWLKNSNSRASNSKVYYALSVLNFLMIQVSPGSSFASKVLATMREHKIFDAGWHTKHMGFPTDWEKEDMWAV